MAKGFRTNQTTMDEVRQAFQLLSPQPWREYTVAWTAATANPTSPSTLVGRYSYNFAWCHVLIELRYDASSGNAGTGAWRFSLPIHADTDANLSGSAFAFDLSATTPTMGAVELVTLSTVQVLLHGQNAPAGDGKPFTWATGDVLRMELLYPVL